MVCRAHDTVLVPKSCSHVRCGNCVVSDGLGVKHGAKRDAPICNHEGCTNWALKNGRCIQHGAERKQSS